MARTAKEKSKTAKAVDTAKDAYEKALDAHAKNSNDTTKRALDGAKARYDEVKKSLSREKFIEITAGRARRAVTGIQALGKALDPKYYSYSPEEGNEIVAATKEAVEHLGEKLKSFLAGKTETKSDGLKFSFEK
jgi:hypothetical protein